MEIYRADDAFKAVAVPAGTHRVHFRFESRMTRIGLVLSVTSFMALAVLLVIAYRARRRMRPQSG